MEFLVAPPVNMGEEGEFIDALGVMDAEGIDMDMDMLLIPIPMPIPVLPSFLVLAPIYEAYPVNIHIQTFLGEGVELHTSIIAGPAMMLSSVA